MAILPIFLAKIIIWLKINTFMMLLGIEVSKEKNIYRTSWVLDLRLTTVLKADARRDNNQVVGCAGALFWGESMIIN